MIDRNSENAIMGMDLQSFLYDFLQIVKRTILFLVGLALLLTLVFCIYARITYCPEYEASATFTVYVVNQLQSEVRGYNTKMAEQMARTFPYILTSSALSEFVRRDLDIPEMPTVTASVLENTNIFTLRVISEDPLLAYDVLTKVIEYYPDISEFVIGPTVMNLLDESGIPAEPCNEVNYRSVAVKGILCAVVLWLAVCLLRTLSRSTVHNEKELKRLMNLRCIGVLPKVKDSNGNAACPLPGKSTEGTGFEESVHLVRIRAARELRERNVQVLIVSSAISGEGKTTVSLNLAIALAGKGKKTLLIDCDFRNPSVAQYIGHENANGLIEYIDGQVQAEDIICETEYDNLSIVYAGDLPDAAAERLASERTGEFVRQCRSRFDFIILDTPPVSLLPDVSEVAGTADGALLTIRQDYATKREILESASILSDSGLALIGYVMNFSSAGPLTGYDNYYGYGKYYGG